MIGEEGRREVAKLRRTRCTRIIRVIAMFSDSEEEGEGDELREETKIGVEGRDIAEARDGQIKAAERFYLVEELEKGIGLMELRRVCLLYR